jgi:hypothetical protein
MKKTRIDKNGKLVFSLQTPFSCSLCFYLTRVDTMFLLCSLLDIAASKVAFGPRMFEKLSILKEASPRRSDERRLTSIL